MADTSAKGSKTGMIVMIILLVVLVGVGGYEYYTITQKNTEITNLTTDKTNLTAQRDSLNTSLNDYVNTVNEVATRLQTIRNNQVTITELIARTDTAVPGQRDQLLNDISAIESQLDKDKRDLNDLTQKMEQANIRIRSLENMVAQLRKELDKNVQTVAELRSIIESKNEQIKVAEATIKNNESTIATVRNDLSNTNRQLTETRNVLEETRNTAYYLVGTKTELKERSILVEKGFLIRKTLSLAPEVNDAAFTKIDITQARQMNIDTSVENIQLVPARATGSYSLEAAGENASILRITDPAAFWKIRYMTIVVKG